MKYNIHNYNQKAAIDLKLDLKDLLILDWFQTFYPRMRKQIIGNKQYCWIDYESLLEDIPIIEIKTPSGLYKRLQALCDIGILEHTTVKNGAGWFSYYLITEKISLLISSKIIERGGSPEILPGSPEILPGSPEKEAHIVYNSLTIDSSTINSVSKLVKTNLHINQNSENFDKEKQTDLTNFSKTSSSLNEIETQEELDLWKNISEHFSAQTISQVQNASDFISAVPKEDEDDEINIDTSITHQDLQKSFLEAFKLKSANNIDKTFLNGITQDFLSFLSEKQISTTKLDQIFAKVFELKEKEITKKGIQHMNYYISTFKEVLEREENQELENELDCFSTSIERSYKVENSLAMEFSNKLMKQFIDQLKARSESEIFHAIISQLKFYAFDGNTLLFSVSKREDKEFIYLHYNNSFTKVLRAVCYDVLDWKLKNYDIIVEENA